MSKLIFKKDATAQGVAKQRLIETIAKENKRIIDDPYGKKSLCLDQVSLNF